MAMPGRLVLRQGAAGAHQEFKIHPHLPSQLPATDILRGSEPKKAQTKYSSGMTAVVTGSPAVLRPLLPAVTPAGENPLRSAAARPRATPEPSAGPRRMEPGSLRLAAALWRRSIADGGGWPIKGMVQRRAQAEDVRIGAKTRRRAVLFRRGVAGHQNQRMAFRYVRSGRCAPNRNQ